MPVSGFKHPRVWQYGFLPQPVSLLDRGWDNHDRAWERDVVEKLRRGEPAPQAGSISDLSTGFSGYDRDHGGSWKHAEEWSKNANRTNAVFLNDEAIARRLPEREAREKAYAEYLREWAEHAERLRARQAEMERERERVAREQAKREFRRRQEKERQDREWAEEDRKARAARAGWTERDAILKTQWQCKCGTITHIAWDSGRNLFLIWCPVCNVTKYKDHKTLADRYHGRS